MSMVEWRQVDWKQVEWKEVMWRDSNDTTDFPRDQILYMRVKDGLKNQIGNKNPFASSVLGPQYQRNADGSHTDVGANPAVDSFDGEKWLRTCGAVTNIVTNGDFSHAYWTKGASVTVVPEVGINGPCGQAYRYEVSASPTAVNLVRLLTVTTSIPHTVSVFFKYVSGRWFRLMWYDGSGNQCRAWFDALNGVLGTVSNGGTATGTTAQITSHGDGWYRIDVSGTIITTGGYLHLSAQDGDNSTQLGSGCLLLCGPQLTASAYPLPYTPPGTTMPASHATTTNGPWFAMADGSPVWNALSGGPMTLATRVRMGVGSGDLPDNTAQRSIVSCFETNVHLQSFRASSDGLQDAVVTSSDGIALPGYYGVGWDHGAVVRRVTQVNTAGTQFRVGYMIEGTHATIQWSSWVNFDGSFNPSTLYKLMLGFNNIYPMWFNKIAMWNTQADDATILKWMKP